MFQKGRVEQGVKCMLWVGVCERGDLRDGRAELAGELFDDDGFRLEPVYCLGRRLVWFL